MLAERMCHLVIDIDVIKIVSVRCVALFGLVLGVLGVRHFNRSQIISIDNRRSTVILRRCKRTDRRYRPCCPVGGTEPTVDIDRDQPTGRLIGGLVSISNGFSRKD